MREWTNSEIKFLKSNFAQMTDEEIALKLNRTIGSIERKRSRLGLMKHLKCRTLTNKEVADILNTKATYREIAELFNITQSQVRTIYRRHGKKSLVASRDLWTDDEVEFLKANYLTKGDFEIGRILRRSSGAITKKRTKLGLTRQDKRIIENPNERNWSSSDIDFLIANIDYMSYEELAEALNRSIKAVMVKATKLGIISNGSRWSEQELAVLRNYSYKTPSQLAFMLNRTEKAIRHKLHQLGITLTTRGGSDIEKEVESILQTLKVDYRKQVILGSAFKFRADFVVGNIVIEVNGDYWHGNPRVYPEPNTMQQTAIEKDNLKKEYFMSLGYSVYEIWEIDLRKDKLKVTNEIALLLSNQ